MKLCEFYAMVVKFGAKNDPRPNKKSIYSFADSKILYGNPNQRIKKILVGIDIEVPEILLADKLRSISGLDMVLSHHPEGQAYAQFFNVMRLQVFLMNKAGVRKTVAQEYLEERLREVERRVLPQNHMRPVDAARLLDIPFMCAHTPADNHVHAYIAGLFARKKPRLVQDIINMLENIPEYRLAKKELNIGPKIILGHPSRTAGKIFLEMTGGTEGPKNIYDKLQKNGVGTIVSMHLSDEHLAKVKSAGMNVIIAGHISSDNIGLNLLLDNIEKASGTQLETLECSGFRRIRR